MRGILTWYEAMRMVRSASIPWAISNNRPKEKIEFYDSESQIALCCACCKAKCTNCVKKKQDELHRKYIQQNKGGRGHKRDTTIFVKLAMDGYTKEQIINELKISERTYQRLEKQRRSI